MTVPETRTTSMRIPFLQNCHRIRLIALMALMLLGGQLLQHSPLHNHSHEVVDCAMCHLQSLGDDTEHEQAINLPAVAATAVLATASIASPLIAFASPYQGRAPPRHSF